MLSETCCTNIWSTVIIKKEWLHKLSFGCFLCIAYTRLNDGWGVESVQNIYVLILLRAMLDVYTLYVHTLCSLCANPSM